MRRVRRTALLAVVSVASSLTGACTSHEAAHPDPEGCTVAICVAEPALARELAVSFEAQGCGVVARYTGANPPPHCAPSPPSDASTSERVDWAEWQEPLTDGDIVPPGGPNPPAVPSFRVWAIPEGSGGWLLKLTLDRDKPYTVGDFAVPRDGASLAIRRGIKMFRSSANFAWSLRMSTGVVVRTQWAIGAETMDCAGAQVMRQLYELGYPVVATRVTQHDRAFVRLSLKGPCEQPSLRIAAASPAEDPYFFDKTYRDADTAAIVQELVDDPRWVPATKQAERVARKGGGAVAPMAYPSIEWVRTICDNERRSCL